MKIIGQSALLLLILVIAGAANGGWPLAAEHKALSAVMTTFNHPIINATWNGIQCSSNHSSWFGIRCINNRVVSIKLESIGLTGRMDSPLALSAFAELAFLSFRNNSISGEMMDFSANTKLHSIDLSINGFTGPISGSLLGLNLLQSVHLQTNQFSGSVPPLYQTTLRTFNVSGNNLTGEVPATEALLRLHPSSYSDNPGLSYKAVVNNQQNHHHHQHHKKIISTPTIVAIAAFFLLNAVILRSLFCRKAKETEKSEDVNSITIECAERRTEGGTVTFLNGTDEFDLDDVLRFSAEGLGKGGFGSCYKARLSRERAIVVKRLRDLSPFTSEEFGRHMGAIGCRTHPNLLPLIGYYYAMDEKLLFCSFASKGNLYDRIHERLPERTPFDWSSRLAVAVAVARAMEFLHREPAPTASSVPHGNLKSTNVLMNEDGGIVVCDYGMLPLVPLPLAAQRMMAYRSPEYQHGRTVSRKSDVWSYGQLVLELITGKVSVYAATGGVELCSWAHRAVREEWTAEVFDPEIAGKRGVMPEMVGMLKLALRCCERFPERRPEMAEAAREVERIQEMEDGHEEDNESSDASSCYS